MKYLPSYRNQLESLYISGGLDWKLFILEGDSRDDSHGFLKRWANDDPRVHIGQEHVGVSIDIEDRAACWARAGNACFDLTPTEGNHTHFLWLEADLCFPAELLTRLVAHDVDVVAPIVWLGGLFYDTWGFRGTDGVKWTNGAPYHSDYRPWTLLEMNSVGSCVLFKREVLDAGIRFRPTYEDGLLVGMCNNARDRGFKVWADPSTAILHPVTEWEAQMWRCNTVELIDEHGGCSELDTSSKLTNERATHLVALDPDLVRHVFDALFASLCMDLDTNRLEVEVRARERPHRNYDLRIRGLHPDQLGPIQSLKWLTRHAFGSIKPRFGSSFSTDVRIVLEAEH